MKNLVITTALTFLAICALFSQENTRYKHSLRINPIDFGRSEFQLSYELMFKKSSIVFSPSIILKENPDNSTNGYQAMAQYRFYLTNFNKNDRHTFLNVYNYGFYTGVYALFINFNEEFTQGFYNPTTSQYENKLYNRDITAGEGGVLLGVRVDITKRIVLDFNLGGGIRKADVEDSFRETQEYTIEYGVFDRAYTGVKPKSALTIGVTF